MNYLRNKNKITIAVLLITLGLYTVPFSAFGATSTDIEAQKQAKQALLDQLNKQISDYQNQIAQKRKQSATLSNEIGLYDMEIKATGIRIQATRTNIENTQLQIEQTQIQIKEKTAQIEQEKNLLAELIVTLNEYDNTSNLQLGLGSSSFSDFMDQVQYAQSVQSKIFGLIQQIKEIRAKLEKDEGELQINLNKLNDLNDQLSQTQKTLNNQKSSRLVLLQQTKGQESKYQKLLTTSQEEQAKINKEIYDLDQQLRGKTGFNALKAVHGILAYSMDGVLTQKYGKTGFTKLGYDSLNGIDLAAPAGTAIYAAGDGTVYSTGTGTTAYGNWVVIKHLAGGKLTKDIMTLYAHMTKFTVVAGQKVKQGDLIGYEGNTGNTTRLLYGPERGYHLHFGVYDAEGFGIKNGAYPHIYGPYKIPYGYTYNPMDFL